MGTETSTGSRIFAACDPPLHGMSAANPRTPGLRFRCCGGRTCPACDFCPGRAWKRRIIRGSGAESGPEAGAYRRTYGYMGEIQMKRMIAIFLAIGAAAFAQMALGQQAAVVEGVQMPAWVER